MPLYSAEYCEDIFEGNFTTISIHRTEQRAHDAIKEHRESIRKKEKYPFELTENSRWRVDYCKLPTHAKRWVGFKPDNECKEQYIVDFSGVFTDAPSKEMF